MRSLVKSGLGSLLWLASAAPLAALGEDPAPPRAGAGSVVFVCEHGSVKSLIASQWFNRLAAERGLAVRSVSRGLSPDPSVPGPIAERLHADGFDVSGFRPRALVPADLGSASRLVLIGVEPPSYVTGTSLPVDMWEGVPPASQSYEGSRDALRERIAKLLDALGPRDRAR